MSFKYMSTSITAASEVFVVAVGPIACLLLFAGMVIAAIAFYRVSKRRKECSIIIFTTSLDMMLLFSL